VDKANAGLIGLVHKEYERDLWGALERLAGIGYKGVEAGPMDLLKGDVASNMKRFHGLGLKVLTVSASREGLKDSLDKIVRDAAALGARRATVWWGPCESREQVLRDAELYDSAGAKLRSEGITLCYHNHDHEFAAKYDGVYALDLLAAYTDPKSVSFELDVAWITFGGEDPVRVLKRMAGRVPAIHVKDLSRLDERGHFTAVGTGVVKVKESVRAAIETGIEWVVVEQDTLRNLDCWETVTASYLHLKEAGLVL
jgi:sugar phosphate isomerase/epimerase